MPSSFKSAICKSSFIISSSKIKFTKTMMSKKNLVPFSKIGQYGCFGKECVDKLRTVCASRKDSKREWMYINQDKDWKNN